LAGRYSAVVGDESAEHTEAVQKQLQTYGGGESTEEVGGVSEAVARCAGALTRCGRSSVALSA
jgi:hypothetical protein